MSRRGRYVVFALMFVMALALAGLLQRQISYSRSFARNQCTQRQINVAHTNQTWDDLANIERHNQFIDERIRAERVAVYANAKLIVPVCT